MSTQEASSLSTDGVLNLQRRYDLAAKFFPSEWMSLPVTQLPSFSIGDSTFAFQSAIVRCEGEDPTNEEVERMVQMIQSRGNPIGWMFPLCAIKVPHFSEENDPTMRDFLEGNFDESKMTYRTVLISYPFFAEVKQ